MMDRLAVKVLALALSSGLLAGCAKPPRPTAATLLPARPSSTHTPITRPGHSVGQTPTPSATPDVAAVAVTSIALMTREEYGEAISLWNEYLAYDPTYFDGYYQRATARNWGVPGDGYLDRFVQNNLAALADLDRAIGLGLVADGRYFWRRYQVLTDLVSVEPYRHNRQALMGLALDNLMAANAIGPWSDVSRGVVVAALADLGRCDEAIAAGRRHLLDLEEQFPSAPWAHARAHSMLARAYNCKGRWQDAADLYEQALALDPDVDHWTWEYWRSTNLYFLGRFEEALEFLDRDLAEHPSYSGERYFLRALILYDQGKVDQALLDLSAGGSQTWSPNGVYSYLLGRIAADEGDLQGGLDLLRSSEGTMSVEYDPLLDRIRREIHQIEITLEVGSGDLAATPLPAATATLLGTAMPTLAPTPTARYPFDIAALCGCDSRVIDMSQGTGPLLIRSDLELASLFTYIYRFQPEAPVAGGTAVDLTYRIVPFGEIPEENPPLWIEFYSEDSTAVLGSGHWGDNRVSDLGVVGQGGEVTMVVSNFGFLPIYIQDIGVRLVSERLDGGFLIQGPGPAPHLPVQPWPPPDMVVDLSESTGPVTIPIENGPIIRFSPAQPIEFVSVETLEIFVEPAQEGLPLRIVPWSAWSRGWLASEETSPGVFVVGAASSAVDAHGDVVLSLMNSGTDPIELLNIFLRLVIRDEGGTEHVLGYVP